MGEEGYSCEQKTANRGHYDLACNCMTSRPDPGSDGRQVRSK